MVVPTATIRPPRSRGRAIAAAASAPTSYRSLCMRVLGEVARCAPAGTCRRRRAASPRARATPRARSAASSSVVEVQAGGRRGDRARRARRNGLVALAVVDAVGVRRCRAAAARGRGASSSGERIGRKAQRGTASRRRPRGRAPRRRSASAKRERRCRASATCWRAAARARRRPAATRSTSASTAPPLALSPNSRALITRGVVERPAGRRRAAARAGRGTRDRARRSAARVEQARGAALGGGMLRDQLGRQREVEIAQSGEGAWGRRCSRRRRDSAPCAKRPARRRIDPMRRAPPRAARHAEPRAAPSSRPPGPRRSRSSAWCATSTSRCTCRCATRTRRALMPIGDAARRRDRRRSKASSPIPRSSSGRAASWS